MAVSHVHTAIPQFSEFFDPSDTPNFTINWASFIGTSNVSTSTWTLTNTTTPASPPTEVQAYIDGQTTTIILSDLIADQTYEIANLITTDDAEPLNFERSFKFNTKNL